MVVLSFSRTFCSVLLWDGLVSYALAFPVGWTAPLKGRRIGGASEMNWGTLYQYIHRLQSSGHEEYPGSGYA